MFFIYEIRPDSQAGRRRFDPGLPLFIFNNLTGLIVTPLTR